MKKVSVIGLGYIGLPTALVATKNFEVYGFDVDQKKIESINKGISPIEEPGVQDLLTEALEGNRFSASIELQKADFYIIAVPTPFKKDKNPDLSFVFEAAKTIATKVSSEETVILESTVPVGTTQQLKNYFPGAYLAHCPERVLPGKIFHELVHNDRIIGGINQESAQMAKSFYKSFVKGTCFLTDDQTAEMVKLVENSSRDIQIALANQISDMCKTVQIDPFNVIKLANKHPRVNLLQPGCGVGGHCIAVDPWFLIKTFPESSSLLKTARKINDEKPKKIVQSVVTAAKNFEKTSGRKPCILALGLTFKPDSGDLRQSPALQIAQELNEVDGLKLFVHDPFVCKETTATLGLTHADIESGMKRADIVLGLVKHSAFNNIKDMYHDKIVIDPCGIIPHEHYSLREKKNETNFSQTT